MNSERSMKGVACRWCVVAVLPLLCSLLSATVAQAQVQTFFVNVPAVSEQRDAMELCRDRFTAALVRVGGFRANQDAVTQQSVTDCLGENASATAKRECEVSMANIEVDFLIVPIVRRLGEQWNWGIKALSPAQGAAQIWGGDEVSNEADGARAAYATCDRLARDFACSQGVAQACSGSAPVSAPKVASSYVVGQVIDATSKSPLEDVRIRYLEAGFSDQLTGKDGKFRSMDLPVGSKVTIQLSASGFVARSMRMAVAATPVSGTIELAREPAVVPDAPIANPQVVGRPSISPAGGSGTQCPAGYVRIAPGTFMMGSPASEVDRVDIETQHSVTISRAYCMKATEVTQGEWQSVIGSTPSSFKNCGENCPVESVRLADVVGYANALSRREGLPECYAGSTFTGLGCRGYRLPTEAEWEYAARAGTTAATYRDLDNAAWYDKNSGRAPHPVGQKQPNAWGLYDMLGNVYEWTGDWYGTYPGRVTDPLGPATGSNRVIRGGSWSIYASNARAAGRGNDPPGNRSSDLGFRLVRTVSGDVTEPRRPALKERKPLGVPD